MINVNDLRIFNLVEVPSDRKNESLTRQVVGIALYPNELIQTFFIQECAYAKWKPSQINPIHITEEWLVKFGFDNKEKTHCYGMPNGFSLQWNGEYLDLYPQEEGAIALEHIKYIHQLQNLYFSLTGEELQLQHGSPG